MRDETTFLIPVVILFTAILPLRADDLKNSGWRNKADGKSSHRAAIFSLRLSKTYPKLVKKALRFHLLGTPRPRRKISQGLSRSWN